MTTGNSLATEAETPTVARSPAPAPVPGIKAPAQPTPTQSALSLRLAVGLVGMLLASLLAILNEQVTAVSMADIQGAFSIGHDDGTWLTALFEAANVATMVFAPWFGITFTLKRFTIGAVIATMLFGILCPFATNLLTLYVLRVLQGMAGGCLPPMLIIVALRYLPPKVKLYGLAGYALTATFGPSMSVGKWPSGKSCRWVSRAAWRSSKGFRPIRSNSNGSRHSTGPDF
jgi:MFS transporter, DHA2 family, multidrug resistance protein